LSDVKFLILAKHEKTDYSTTISSSLIFVLPVILKSFINSLPVLNAAVAVKSYGGPDICLFQCHHHSCLTPLSAIVAGTGDLSELVRPTSFPVVGLSAAGVKGGSIAGGISATLQSWVRREICLNA